MPKDGSITAKKNKKNKKTWDPSSSKWHVNLLRSLIRERCSVASPRTEVDRGEICPRDIPLTEIVDLEVSRPKASSAWLSCGYQKTERCQLQKDNV